jgi:hypothetical protein
LSSDSCWIASGGRHRSSRASARACTARQPVTVPAGSSPPCSLSERPPSTLSRNRAVAAHFALLPRSPDPVACLR